VRTSRFTTTRGLYLETGEGKRLAETRFEELRSARIVANGAATTRRMMPGFRFKMDEHPRSDWNGKEYVILGVHSSGSQPQSEEEDAGGGVDGPQYSSSFECIPAPTRIVHPGSRRSLPCAAPDREGRGSQGREALHGRTRAGQVHVPLDLEGKGTKTALLGPCRLALRR